MSKYTDQFGREFEAPDHKTAKYVARSMLTPPQRVDYATGKLQLYVVDDLGRKHHLLCAGKA